ncbi:MAG: SDR family oxidoreductase [Rubrivivax sp.]
MTRRRAAAADAPPPTALVTGASAGIGEALARCIARDGHALVLVARSAGRLRTLAAELRARHGVRIDVLPCDLSRRGAAARLGATLQRRGIAVDVLVNNAGVLEQGAFAAADAATHQKLIDLNVSALTAMLAAFVPGMVQRGRGRVLNVASIAAFQPVPSLACYAATKAYVLSLTESLAEELRPAGVGVTALCPGITATGMLDGAAQANPALARLPAFVVGEVQAVAEAGWQACLKGEAIVVPGVVNQAATWATRSAPRWLVRRVAGILGRAVE